MENLKVKGLKQELEEKNKHFDFQFTDKEYEYFMANARLKPIEKQVLEMRRKDMKEYPHIIYLLEKYQQNTTTMLFL